MKLKKKLIEKLAKGEIAVENNGTLEQLKRILEKAFFENNFILVGIFKYYFKNAKLDVLSCSNETEKPSIPATEFFKKKKSKYVKISKKEIINSKDDKKLLNTIKKLAYYE
jgi:hypothetical protein